MAGSREDLLGTGPLSSEGGEASADSELQELTRYVAQACNAPYALLAVEGRGKSWFKCRVGIEATEAPPADPEREGDAPGIEVIEDAARDPRRAVHPLLSVVPEARFLAAAPIREGPSRLGTLAVLDRRARSLAPHQAEALRVAAVQASAVLRLRRRVRLLEALLDSSPDQFHAFDARGRYLYASERAARAMGFTSAQMLGRSWQDLGWDPQYAPQFSGMLRLALDTGQLIEDARALVTPAGLVQTEYVLAPLRGSRGEIEGVVVTARDVTARVAAEAERRAAEAELQTRDELFRAVIEGSQDAIFVKDRDGRYRMVNSAGARYLGHEVQEMLGRTDAELVDEGNARVSMESDRAVLATGEPVVYERFASFHGEERFFITTKGPWRDASGRILGIFGVARDITARKKMEEELRGLLQTAEKAVQQRDDVLAVVSHDLRNVLGIFRLTASLLERELPADAEQAQQRLKVLQGHAESMGRLVDDLIEVGRIDAGSLRIVPSGCEARALAKDAIAAVEPVAQQKGIGLALEAPDAPVPIDCDRGRILQVFANVLGNAVKFTDRGEVRVEVAGTDGEVRFSIRDSGGGISPDHLPHLFERYWQARQGERSGAGLGLYIARGIVEAHGGRIWAESAESRGTTICFTLPRR